MIDVNPNSQAFPLLMVDGIAYSVVPGLTKREYFAAIAMQGLLAADVNFVRDDDYLAKRAVHQADLLIQELNHDT